MRYGSRPRSKAHRPEQVLRKAIVEHKEIKRWVEIAYPFFMVEVECLEERTEEITRLEYFILRSIHEANAHSIQSIALLLGLEAKYIERIVNYLVTVDHLVEMTDIGLYLTENGIQSLQTNQKQLTKMVPKCILLDGISKEPLPIDFYHPMNHSLNTGDRIPKSIRRLIPSTVEEADLKRMTTELSREEKAKLGLSPDLVDIVYDSMGYEIVYHIFHAAVLDKERILVFDSCTGDIRTEFKTLDYQALKEVIPQIEEKMNVETFNNLLLQDFQLKVSLDDVHSDKNGHMYIYVTKTDFDHDKGWEYTILTKPNVLLFNGTIVHFYPKDELTIKAVLLRYLLRKFKLAIGAGEVQEFNLQETSLTGFKEIMGANRIGLKQPEILMEDLRDYALENKEHHVHEVLLDLMENNDKDMFDFLFTE